MNKTNRTTRFYLAPMEGVTGYIFRNVQHEMFGHVDKYFTPFIAANQTGKLKSKEKQDILPEHNTGLNIVPQILTNNPEDFIRTTTSLNRYGYKEVNLNLGCPSGTVVAKCKGAGFLAQKDRLNSFLEEIFSKVSSDTKISIKTRLGIEDGEEFYDLLEIYNRYPLEELIIHPRVQKDYYKNTPNLVMFKEALPRSKHPICYNGDIFSVEDYQRIQEEFKEVSIFMLGRGLIGNPALIKQIREEYQIDKMTLRKFHDRILAEYQNILSGDINVLYKMKELWFYMMPMFEDSEKYLKKIRKCTHLDDYKMIITQLFLEKQLATNPSFYPR